VTDEDFRNGRPAALSLALQLRSPRAEDRRRGSREFAADTAGPAKELSTQRRRSFAQERRQQIDQA
jgi:hypothetical protein